MSGPGFVDGGTFSAAILCLMAHCLTKKCYRTGKCRCHSFRLGRTPAATKLDVRLVGPDQPLNDLRKQSIRSILGLPIANLVGRTR